MHEKRVEGQALGSIRAARSSFKPDMGARRGHRQPSKVKLKSDMALDEPKNSAAGLLQL